MDWNSCHQNIRIDWRRAVGTPSAGKSHFSTSTPRRVADARSFEVVLGRAVGELLEPLASLLRRLRGHPFQDAAAKLRAFEDQHGFRVSDYMAAHGHLPGPAFRAARVSAFPGRAALSDGTEWTTVARQWNGYFGHPDRMFSLDLQARKVIGGVELFGTLHPVYQVTNGRPVRHGIDGPPVATVSRVLRTRGPYGIVAEYRDHLGIGEQPPGLAEAIDDFNTCLSNWYHTCPRPGKVDWIRVRADNPASLRMAAQLYDFDANEVTHNTQVLRDLITQARSTGLTPAQRRELDELTNHLDRLGLPDPESLLHSRAWPLIEHPDATKLRFSYPLWPDS